MIDIRQEKFSYFGKYQFNYNQSNKYEDMLKFNDISDELNSDLVTVPLYLYYNDNNNNDTLISFDLFNSKHKEYNIVIDFYFLFNDDLIGYFRINYDGLLLELIMDNWSKISFGNQLSVIYDMYYNMRYNYIEINVYLDFINDIIEYLDNIKMYELNEEHFYLYYSLIDIISKSLVMIDENIRLSMHVEDENENEKQSKRSEENINDIDFNSDEYLKEFRKFGINVLKPIYFKVYEWEYINATLIETDINISWWNSNDWKNLKLVMLNTLLSA